MSGTSAAVKTLLTETGLPYSSSMESTSLLQAWSAERGSKICLMINNSPVEATAEHSVKVETCEDPSPTSGLVISTASLSAFTEAVEAARKSTKPTLPQLATFFYCVARHLQKQQGILALALAVDSKRSSQEIKKHDIPLAIQTVYYYAGLAARLDAKSYSKGGDVVCIIPSQKFPLLDILVRICPALLASSAVVLSVPVGSSRTVAIMVDILVTSGINPGTIAFLPFKETPIFSTPVEILEVIPPWTGLRKPLFDNVQSAVSKGIFQQVNCVSQRRSSMIILDSADLESAVACILEAALFGGGTSRMNPSKIVVQETVYENVLQLLKGKLMTLRQGHHLDKAVDYSCAINAKAARNVLRILDEATNEGAEVVLHKPFSALDGLDDYKTVSCPVVLLAHVAPTSSVFDQEVDGPILGLLPFRTLREAVTLADNGFYGNAVSVWSENSACVMEIARNVRASTVWINSCHQYDAGIGGGSGLMPFSGEDAICNFVSMNSSDHPENPPLIQQVSETRSPTDISKVNSIDRTYKLYYGGGQKRPESGTSIEVKLTNEKSAQIIHLPDAGAKDMKNCIEAALSGAASWSKATPFNRSQILFYIAENLSARMGDFEQILMPFHRSPADAKLEIEQSVQRLFFWAGQCSKANGEVHNPNQSFSVLQIREPVGIVSIIGSRRSPLLSFVTLVGAALAQGNSVIMVPYIENAVVALEFYQILETSDVPNGVVNIVTGNQQTLVQTLGAHGATANVWVFDEAVPDPLWNQLQSTTLNQSKTLWKPRPAILDWVNISPDLLQLFKFFCVRDKLIWVPIVESFAN